MNPHFQHLNAQLSEWQSLQPLKREDHDRLWRKLRLDWNYHSNHIEGNTLTYGETEILLVHDQATGDHGLRDYMEMKAHDVAIEHMKALAKEDRPITEGDIRDFNRLLIKESFWKEAITPDGQASQIEILPGEYKKQPNNVRTAGGDIFRFADPADVPIRMGELIAWLRDALEKKELHSIEIAAKLHHDFVLIHPFGDGNGRTARILVNYVLMRNGYLPLVVPTEQKDRYLAALRRADTGELEALTDYLATCLETSMSRGIAAANGESIEEADDLLKEIELLKRRQTGESRNVIRKSGEVIRTLYKENLRPLFDEFVQEMGRLDDLFAEVLITSNAGELRGKTWQKFMDEWADKPTVSQTTNINLSYTLHGYKGNAPKPVNVAATLSVVFDEFHYRINGGGDRLYAAPFPESERKALARVALESAFAKIKKEAREE